MMRITFRRRTRRVRTRRTMVSWPGRSSSRRAAKVRALIGCPDLKLAERLAEELTGCPRVEAVGVATTPAEAARKVAALKPDVAVLDVGLGGDMRGIDTGLALQHSGVNPGLLMLSPYDDRQRLGEMPAGMGTEWSCLFTETAMEPGALAYALQCAAWSVPVVDPKMDQVRPAADSVSWNERRAARLAGRGAAGTAGSHASGWRGAVQTFSPSHGGGPSAQ